MKVIIETKRTILREMTDDDFPMLLRVIKVPNSGEPIDKYAKRWISWCKDSYQKYGFGHLAVILKETNEFIGSAGISMQYIDDDWKPEIGYHIRKDFHRQGLGKEVAAVLRDYFFNQYDYDEVFSYMDEDNIPSYKTAESIGMSFLHLYHTKNGETYRVYSINRYTWKKQFSHETL